MEAIALALFEMLDSVFQYAGIKAKRKYRDIWFENEQAIKDERAKWPVSNDRKLEDLYANRKIVVDLARAEMAEAMAGKAG